MLIALLCILGFVFYVMNPDERVRVLRPVRAFGSAAGRTVVRAIAAGHVWVRAVRAHRPWAMATVAAAAALLVIALISQASLRHLADVRPEIERLIAAEARTVRAYDAAVAQFKLGALPAEALAQTINRRIVPELQAVRLRLMSLGDVPEAHAAVLSRAREYVRLRDESWRLRSQALQQRNMTALRKADTAERASLAAFAAVVAASRSL